MSGPVAAVLEQSARERSAAEVARWAEEVDRRTQKCQADEAEASALESDAGAALLDDESGTEGQKRSERIGALRARARLEAQASAEADRRRQAAVSQCMRDEAAELEPALHAGEKTLAEHRTKLDRLLTQLRKHSGLQWRPVTFAVLIDEQLATQGSAAGMTWTMTPEELAERDLQVVKDRRTALLAAADGRSVLAAVPSMTADQLPKSLFPGSGLVQLDGFGDGLDSAKRRVADAVTSLDYARVELRAREAELERLEDNESKGHQFEGDQSMLTLLGQAHADQQGALRIVAGSESALATHRAGLQAEIDARAAAAAAFDEVVQRMVSGGSRSS